MRVTLIHNGSPYYVLGLANALASSCDVTVMHSETLGETCQKLARRDVRCIAFADSVPSRSSGVTRKKDELFLLIKETQPDVLHVQETFQYSPEFYQTFLRFSTRVITIHDAVTYATTTLVLAGIRSANALNCWRTSHLIVHSPIVRELLMNEYGASADSIATIPHGELGSLYHQLAQPEEMPIERDPFGLLFFGNARRHRGLQILLAGFRTIAKNVPQARLRICGYGPGKLDQYNSLVDGLDHVEWGPRFIPESQVYRHFLRNNLVILPYLQASQSGVAAIAFTSGAIVVASRVGSFPHMIEHNRTGILVPPGDPLALSAAITAVLLDSRVQLEIRNNSRALGASAMNWNRIAERTMHVYNRLGTDHRKQR